MLNVRLKYNFNMMMRVKSLKINLWKGDKPISIDIEGFDIGKPNFHFENF